MTRLVRTIAVPVTENTVTEQLSDAINALENLDKKLVPAAMRQWLLAGFQLSQLEHGIIDSWVGLGMGGQMHPFSKKQRAEILKNIIERTMWFEDLTAPDLTVHPVAKPKKKPTTKNVAGIPTGFDLQGL